MLRDTHMHHRLLPREQSWGHFCPQFLRLTHRTAATRVHTLSSEPTALVNESSYGLCTWHMIGATHAPSVVLVQPPSERGGCCGRRRHSVLDNGYSCSDANAVAWRGLKALAIGE